MAPSDNSGPQIFDDASRAPNKSSMFRAIMKPHKRNQSADDAITSRPLPRSKPSDTIPMPFGEEVTLPRTSCHWVR